MKYFAALLFSLALLVQQASADSLLAPYRYATGVEPTIEFCGFTNLDTNADPYTYSGHAVCSASGDRLLVIFAFVEDSSNDFDISSLTVDGVAASELVQGCATTVSCAGAAFQIIDTADLTDAIVIDLTEPATSASVAVYAVKSYSSSIAVDTFSGVNTANLDPMTFDCDTVDGGVAMYGFGQTGTAAAPTAWSIVAGSIVETYDNAGAEHDAGGAMVTDTPTQAANTATANLAAGGASGYRFCASYR